MVNSGMPNASVDAFFCGAKISKDMHYVPHVPDCARDKTEDRSGLAQSVTILGWSFELERDGMSSHTN